MLPQAVVWICELNVRATRRHLISVSRVQSAKIFGHQLRAFLYLTPGSGESSTPDCPNLPTDRVAGYS